MKKSVKSETKKTTIKKSAEKKTTKAAAPVSAVKIKHSYRFFGDSEVINGLPSLSSVLPSPFEDAICMSTTATLIGVIANGTDTGWKISILRSSIPGCCHITMASMSKHSFTVIHASKDPVLDTKVQFYIVEMLTRLGAGNLKTLLWDINYFQFREDLTRQNPNLEAYRLAARCGMYVDLGLDPRTNNAA